MFFSRFSNCCSSNRQPSPLHLLYNVYTGVVRPVFVQLNKYLLVIKGHTTQSHNCIVKGLACLQISVIPPFSTSILPSMTQIPLCIKKKIKNSQGVAYQVEDQVGSDRCARELSKACTCTCWYWTTHLCLFMNQCVQSLLVQYENKVHMYWNEKKKKKERASFLWTYSWCCVMKPGRHSPSQ